MLTREVNNTDLLNIGGVSEQSGRLWNYFGLNPNTK